MLALRSSSVIPKPNCFTKIYKTLTTNSQNLTICFSSNSKTRQTFSATTSSSSSNVVINSPFSGLEDNLVGYVMGKKKATEAAHLVWKSVIQKGDTVIDATCGNGYDTLAMLKLVADGSGNGRVYAMDMQTDALDNTATLLNENVTSEEKDLVKLFSICHSRMEEILPDDSRVRDELEKVESFSSGLPVDDWVCCKFQMLNRPVAPVLVFLFKR
ncbi:uncharacterized protein LOC126671328 isoform X2 [Mercurialis annua]|uniref:uncharacterized protein LOC126671328 isoform X2 n=1 Tax=Mercurialis annua TaxID=3986 RepID=UPI002160BFD4|nr:uncharacterized protein LOC126671328 isoform X2 [Mercurialis annua]